ncbi:hypothetical protein, partial [Pelomicrobium sp. G1]|uniref:hypothetical protein n=1 Tax=Pelomicrobium sp. G1 TaxID=3452920 RepID=UPI003F7661C1
VQDGAIVPIDNESRLAKLALDERERPKSGPDFDEVTESEEVECKEKRNTRWAHFEAMVEHDPATIGGHDANHKVVLLGSAPLPIARGMS